jgi:hypothetical protein
MAESGGKEMARILGRDTKMADVLVQGMRSRSGHFRLASASTFGIFLLIGQLAIGAAVGQTLSPMTGSSQLPTNWRDIKDGVGGYPAGPMLEIAVRRTHSDKLEMFKWRSEFIAMLSAQPGPLIEREWQSVLSLPANTGAGTWTGMTWWENQQRWQDMANLLFPTPVAEKWLKTLDMTLVFVKPLDSKFDLHTLAQSGGQVLELGLLVFPTSGTTAAVGDDPAAAQTYLDALKNNGAETYQFAIYKNPTGFIGPYTVAYNKNGPPGATGEKWFVYMATYESAETRARLQSLDEVRRAFEALTNSMVKEHSDIQVMTRTTSQVCIKSKTHTYSLDPDDCHVGVMGSGDTWAASYSERPQPCITDYNVYSQLPPKTCDAVGGRRVDARPEAAHP